MATTPTTAPRLFAFEPDVTVQRARWSVSAGSAVGRSAGVDGVAMAVTSRSVMSPTKPWEPTPS